MVDDVELASVVDVLVVPGVVVDVELVDVGADTPGGKVAPGGRLTPGGNNPSKPKFDGSVGGVVCASAGATPATIAIKTAASKDTRIRRTATP